jgi:hypothetical protein
MSRSPARPVSIAAIFTCTLHRARRWCAASVLLGVTASVAGAQSGTVTFSGATPGEEPTLAFNGGPALDFSSRLLSGFGDAVALPSGGARWWNGAYSGRDMVYGSSSTLGTVLELRLSAAGGSQLTLEDALFGGYFNTARYISFQLFSDDFSQSTALMTVLTGSLTPTLGLFSTNGWGNAIRLQFTETDANGVASGRGAFDVGIQDIAYEVSSPNGPPSTVPEPGALPLLAAGVTGVWVTMRRRRRAVA